MSGAGLTTIPMSDMSDFGLGCIFILMLMGGICFLLLPPILYRLYQYRQFKPMVQEVLELRKVIRSRAGHEGEEDPEPLQNDLMAVRPAARRAVCSSARRLTHAARACQDFELQDEGLQWLAGVIIVYDLSFLVLGTFVYYGVLMSYVRRCDAMRVCVCMRACAAALTTLPALAGFRGRCRRCRRAGSTTSGSPRSPR